VTRRDTWRDERREAIFCIPRDPRYQLQLRGMVQ
jgi:hypothetical protein